MQSDSSKNMKWKFRLDEPVGSEDPQGIVEKLLEAREVSDIDAFLNPSISGLHDPFLLEGVREACEKILEAINDNKKISIYGDFDVDGISATALMLIVLRKLKGKVDFYIPHRLEEGYGLSMTGIEELKGRGTELIITVDCGMNGILEIEKASELGMVVIVTDHHLPEKKNPAKIKLNPHLSKSYPYKELAGVGVAFKLCQGLAKLSGLSENFILWNLDLVALGTVADVVPLTGENRTITALGLKIMNEGRRPGIVSLLKSARFKNNQIEAWNIAFIIAPRINALGRLEEAKEAVDLLITYDKREADLISAKLEGFNNKRKKIQEKIYREAMDILRSCDLESSAGIVVSGADWHEGVIGIVASKIVEDFCRPAILIAKKDEVCRGSGRSIPGFNIMDCLKGLSDFLEEFGGHSQACGMSIKKEKIEAFGKAFNEEVRRKMGEEILSKELLIDFPLLLDSVNENLVKHLEALAPFGVENPKPVFSVSDIELVGSPAIVGANHLKFIVKYKDRYFSGIGFSLGDKIEFVKERKKISIAYTPFIDEWNGKVSLKIYDIEV
jgi:single-stranded-DNA-specific exonuclease